MIRKRAFDAEWNFINYTILSLNKRKEEVGGKKGGRCSIL